MVRFEWYRSGDLFGITYEFDNAGDTLAEDGNAPGLAHNVMCLAGAVELMVQGKGEILYAGDMADFDNALPHSIKSLDPQTTIMIYYLHGIPPGYAELPEDQHSGTLT